MEFSPGQEFLILVGGIWFLGFTIPVYRGIAKRNDTNFIAIVFGSKRGWSYSAREKLLVAIGLVGAMCMLILSSGYE
jgi:hypothetical protein